MKPIAFVLGLAIAAMITLPCRAARFTVEKAEDGVTVNLDGKLLTRYVFKSGTKPILWPLIGPNGQPITRQYPMKDALPSERNDHIHHRSFWFTHGDVNGISFWHENDGGGYILHKQLMKAEGGETAVIETRNDWVGPGRAGEKQCEDIRRITFGVDGDKVWIDFDTTVTASEGPVTFGDTKEGCFGVRVAGTMKVDAKQGGQIVNSQGQRDQAAWGKAAPWVDYHGPVEGERVGVAIMNHPSSFRYPTHWHVRTYGLFTANPFGLSNFTGSPKGSGDHEMAKGESFSLHYRVMMHMGDEQQGGVAKAFDAYKKSEKKPLK